MSNTPYIKNPSTLYTVIYEFDGRKMEYATYAKSEEEAIDTAVKNILVSKHPSFKVVECTKKQY